MADNSFAEIMRNQVFWTTAASWMIAQTLKVIIGVARERRFNFKWFIGTGGMPSSHVAGVMSLATSIGLIRGFSSYEFAIALVLALIVTFDAQGVRRTVGRQAEILNKILDDIYWKGKVEQEEVREFLGHTPVEVFVGAVLGIVIALVSFNW